jgi:NAD(P)-dependent dehydrogenase (short-subunit alcohol dehydrogenase family)
MAASINSSPLPYEQGLRGQTVLVMGGSSGIGLETARLARAQGADVILTARNPDRLYRAGLELGASIAAFDATDFGRLERFFDALPAPIDHLLISGFGPYHAPLAEFDPDAARRDVDAHLLLPLQAATNVASKVRPGGTLLFLGGACGGRAAPGVAFTAALTAALSAVTRDLAREVAPVRVNLITAGCTGALPGSTRPDGRVASPAGVAALAVRLMTDTVVTGATFDVAASGS